MKFTTIILITILGLSISSYGDSGITNITTDIIEIDCSNQAALFNECSKEYNTSNHLDASPIVEKLKTSELPQKIILHYHQMLNGSHEIIQSTELNGVLFGFEAKCADQAVSINLDYSNPYPFKENDIGESTHTQLIAFPGKTMPFLSFESSSTQSEGSEPIESRKIRITTISIGISG